MNQKNDKLIKYLIAFLIIMLALIFAKKGRKEIFIVRDLVYGHKYGMALTMDVFQPKKQNGAGIIYIMSGGWRSQWRPPESTIPALKDLLEKGFTVFVVRHGSSPKFLVPEIMVDIDRSVRFIRLQAKDFKVNPKRLGITGHSAGAHLSLLLAMKMDDGNPQSKNRVMRESNRVAAVVAFAPPTDLNYPGEDGHLHRQRLPALHFDTDRLEEFSPLFHVDRNAPPVLLIHGDADKVVFLLHSKMMHEALKKNDVPSKLLILKGADHSLSGKYAAKARKARIAWFEKYLL